MSQNAISTFWEKKDLISNFIDRLFPELPIVKLPAKYQLQISSYYIPPFFSPPPAPHTTKYRVNRLFEDPKGITSNMEFVDEEKNRSFGFEHYYPSDSNVPEYGGFYYDMYKWKNINFRFGVDIFTDPSLQR